MRLQFNNSFYYALSASCVQSIVYALLLSLWCRLVIRIRTQKATKLNAILEDTAKLLLEIYGYYLCEHTKCFMYVYFSKLFFSLSLSHFTDFCCVNQKTK